MEKSIFGENLLIYRQNLGITQAELAEKVGVGQVTIANYERGTRFPGEDVLVRIAHSLGITVSLLFSDKTESPREVIREEPFEVDKILTLLQKEDVARTASYVRGWKLYNNYSLEKTFSSILIPALIETGRLWEAGEYSISQEHLISGKIREIVSLLADEVEIKKSGSASSKRWIGFCAPSDHHDLMLFMLYQLLRTEGWDAAFLGTDVPLRDLEEMIKSFKPQIITISCSLPMHRNGLESYLRFLEQMDLTETVISMGGRGVDKNLLKRFPSVRQCAATLKEGFENIEQWKSL